MRSGESKTTTTTTKNVNSIRQTCLPGPHTLTTPPPLSLHIRKLCNTSHLVMSLNESVGQQETDVTGHIESRSADSLLSQLTKEPLGPRHALHASQTEFSPFLWTRGVYKWVGGLWANMGASGPICPRPTSSLWATGRILRPPFPWIRALQTGAKSGHTWSPLRALTRGRQGL